MTPGRTARARRRTGIAGAAMAVLVLLAVTLAGCGGSSSASDQGATTTKPATSTTAPGQPPTVAETAAKPSKKAKMVCADEAQEDIAGVLALKTTAVTTPTWSDSLYSCTYQYPEGSFTLSVKELPDHAATTAYFDGVGMSMGRMHDDVPLGDGAFATPNGSMVVRKDNLVMVVDATHLPPALGKQKLAPADVAETVAVTILGCWKG
jgi:hypothetical protein